MNRRWTAAALMVSLILLILVQLCLAGEGSIVGIVDDRSQIIERVTGTAYLIDRNAVGRNLATHYVGREVRATGSIRDATGRKRIKVTFFKVLSDNQKSSSPQGVTSRKATR